MASPVSTPAASPALPGLPRPRETQVRAGLLTEMFARTWQAAPLGLMPVALLAFAHADAVDHARLGLWVALMCAAGSARWLLAGAFLRCATPTAGCGEGILRWQRLEAAATVAVSVAWTSSVWWLDTGSVDDLFYLKLTVLIAIAGFMQNTQGMVPAIFAGFLIVFAAMLVAFLATWPAPSQRQAVLLQVGILIYATVLMLRSEVEYQRVRQWIEARLSQEALVARLNELASRDTLTGAFSRAHVQQALRGFVSAQQREGMPWSVLMLDVDRFKSINDEHGHAVGDEVLRRMTTAVAAELRPGDLWGRWGGEEFIVVLPGTRCGAAVDIAERLRRRMTQLDFGSVGAAGLGVTVSIGVAQAQPDESADATILRADNGLYRAKREGRNRVRLAAGRETPVEARPVCKGG